MDRKLLAAILFTVVFAFAPVDGAQDKPTVADDDLRTEIRELKRLVLDLSDRLDVLDRRLSRLEQERRSSHEVTDSQSSGRRPLGNYSVDKNGIIWDGNLPIGVWGVWGRREVESAGHVHR